MKTVFVLLIVCNILVGYSQTGNQSGFANFDEEKEKSAILEVLKAETESFFKRDYESWKKFYINADYAFQAWNNADGTFDAKVGWSEVDEKIGNYIRSNPVPAGSASHPKVERRNMVWKFFTPEVAFMIWDQYNSDTAMKIYNHSKETRIMEKQGGLWKVVNVTAFWDYKNNIPMDIFK